MDDVHAALVQPDFNASTWVDAALRSQLTPELASDAVPSLAAVDALFGGAATLLVRVHVLAGATHERVAGVLSGAQASAARLQSDARVVERSVNDLRAGLQAIAARGEGAASARNTAPGGRDTVSGATETTAAVTSELDRLARAHSRADDVLSLLHRTCTWARLVREVTEEEDPAPSLPRLAERVLNLEACASEMRDLLDVESRSRVLSRARAVFDVCVRERMAADAAKLPCGVSRDEPVVVSLQHALGQVDRLRRGTQAVVWLCASLCSPVVRAAHAALGRDEARTGKADADMDVLPGGLLARVRECPCVRASAGAASGRDAAAWMTQYLADAALTFATCMPALAALYHESGGAASPSDALAAVAETRTLEAAAALCVLMLGNGDRAAVALSSSDQARTLDDAFRCLELTSPQDAFPSPALDALLASLGTDFAQLSGLYASADAAAASMLRTVHELSLSNVFLLATCLVACLDSPWDRLQGRLAVLLQTRLEDEFTTGTRTIESTAPRPSRILSWLTAASTGSVATAVSSSSSNRGGDVNAAVANAERLLRASASEMLTLDAIVAMQTFLDYVPYVLSTATACVQDAIAAGVAGLETSLRSALPVTTRTSVHSTAAPAVKPVRDWMDDTPSTPATAPGSSADAAGASAIIREAMSAWHSAACATAACAVIAVAVKRLATRVATHRWMQLSRTSTVPSHTSEKPLSEWRLQRLSQTATDGLRHLASEDTAAVTVVSAVVPATPRAQLFRSFFEALLAPVAAAMQGVRSLSVWSSVSASDDDAAAYSRQPSVYATKVTECLLTTANLMAPHNHPLVRQASAVDGAAPWIAVPGAFGGVLPSVGAVLPHATPSPRPHAATVAGHAASLPSFMAAFAVGAADVLRQVATPELASVCDVVSYPAARGKPEHVRVACETLDRAVAACWMDPGHASCSALAENIATAEATLWLQALATGVSAVLLHEFLRIPRLSSAGAQQLKTDLELITSVWDAMGMLGDELLTRFVELACSPARELAKLVDASSPMSVAALHPDSAAAAEHMRDANLRRFVARMRGVTTSM